MLKIIYFETENTEGKNWHEINQKYPKDLLIILIGCLLEKHHYDRNNHLMASN